MAAFLVDLDGTVIRFHERAWLPGAIERLANLHRSGHEIVFVTMRGERDKGTDWSREVTEELFQQLTFPYRVLWDVQSPRVLVDDTSPFAIHVPRNDIGSWPEFS